MGAIVKANNNYRVLVTMALKSTPFLPVLDKTAFNLFCKEDDLVGMIKELNAIKAECNSIANSNGFPLRDYDIKFELKKRG